MRDSDDFDPDAYLRFADGTRGSPAATVLIKIEGGPAWLNSDQYTIEAESDGAFTNQMKAGPMMQTLLEDRFQLRVHRETRESQVYALTEAKGGSKISTAKARTVRSFGLHGLTASVPVAAPGYGEHAMRLPLGSDEGTERDCVRAERDHAGNNREPHKNHGSPRSSTKPGSRER